MRRAARIEPHALQNIGAIHACAATLMRISFGFGVGVGRSAGIKTSGPPGLEISTAHFGRKGHDDLSGYEGSTYRLVVTRCLQLITRSARRSNDRGT
jgi:hypothetical protein